MKTSLNSIFVIHDPFRDKPVSLPESIRGDKTLYDPVTAMITRRLLYESRAGDVFWIHRSKNQKKNYRMVPAGKNMNTGIGDDHAE